MPSHLPFDLRRRLEPIRLLVLDVDGVLTDGSLLYGAEGCIGKSFNVRDGLGIRLLAECGITVGVISGRSEASVSRRLEDLGVDPSVVVLGSRNKMVDLAGLQVEAGGLADHQTAVMGDDLPDLPMLLRAGFSACPSDAAPDVAAVCHLVCGAAGGQGAVREVAEVILKAQGRWSGLVQRWMTDHDGPRKAG
jgi:3-deoxy-D-manno-octulosonate 8-phosphate phosphatase (KDO 8-P phosphatase)